MFGYLFLCRVIVDKAYVPPKKRHKRSASVVPDIIDSHRRSRSRKSKVAAIKKISDFVEDDAKIKDNGELKEQKVEGKQKSANRRDHHGDSKRDRRSHRSSGHSKKDKHSRRRSRRSKNDDNLHRRSGRSKKDDHSRHNSSKSKSVTFDEPETEKKEDDLQEQSLRAMIQQMHENIYSLKGKPSIFKSITLEDYLVGLGWIPTTEPFFKQLYHSAHESTTAIERIFISEADFGHYVIIGLLSVLYNLHSWFASIHVKIELPASFGKIFLQDILNHSMYVLLVCHLYSFNVCFIGVYFC